jgi:hypothetical protein
VTVAPMLLVRVDGTVGLTEELLADLLEFADRP